VAKAFTLVELLVVIGIILIIAALLFPAFARSKASAKQTACLTQLGQIGTTIGLYMTDSDDVFPIGVDASDKFGPGIWSFNPVWQARVTTLPLLSDLLQPYVKSKDVFRCPTDSGTEVLENNFPTPFASSPSLFQAYGSSYFLRTEIVLRALHGTSFQKPSGINVLFDAAGDWHGAGRELRPSDDTQTFLGLVHDFRYNVLFGDYHCKNLSHGGLQVLWATPL
jgi:prepilin-type N-terminal cleavage/methylation domain-containing protein